MRVEGVRDRRYLAGTNQGNARSVRHHHRGWRLGRLGLGPPALRQERQQGSALRGGTGHAARQRAVGDSGQLFGHGLFRSALPLDRAPRHDTSRQPQQSGRDTPSPAQIRAGARAGRRVLDQWPIGQPRRADRLRRMGGTGCRGLGLEGRAALLQESRARPRFRRCTAGTAASRFAASRKRTGHGTRKPSPKPASSPATRSCPTRTASSSKATSR